MIEKIKNQEEFIREILNKERIWELSDKVLYDMCREHPFHKTSQEIIMKTLIIGRVYSVQLERRKSEKKKLGDRFYDEDVIPKFRDYGLDERLIGLGVHSLTPSSFHEILSVHKFLMDKIHDITEHNNRSFCSKYLHFHFPNLFFIYDSRSSKSVSVLGGKVSIENKSQYLSKDCPFDRTYVNFFLKCYNLKIEIETVVNRELSIREYDTILIELSNHLKENQKT